MDYTSSSEPAECDRVRCCYEVFGQWKSTTSHNVEEEWENIQRSDTCVDGVVMVFFGDLPNELTLTTRFKFNLSHQIDQIGFKIQDMEIV